MQVYVLMGNDYPAAVLDDKAKAHALVEWLEAKARDTRLYPRFPSVTRIYWKIYEFELGVEPPEAQP